MPRVKVTITGYYNISDEHSTALAAIYDGAQTHAEAIEIDRDAIKDSAADATDVLCWLDTEPQIVLELEN